MNISLKTKSVLFSILFLIGIVLLIFFPYGSIFLLGTEVLYSGAQVILDKINKSTDLWFNKILLVVSICLTLINTVTLLII